MFGNVVERDNQPVVTYEHSGVDSLSFNGTYYPIYHLVGKTWSNDERSIKFRESPYYRTVKAYELSVLYPIFTNCSYAVDPDGNIFVVKDGIWQKAIDICGTDDYESEAFNRLRRLVVYTYVKWKVPRDEYIRGFFGIDIDTYNNFLNNNELKAMIKDCSYNYIYKDKTFNLSEKDNIVVADTPCVERG